MHSINNKLNYVMLTLLLTFNLKASNTFDKVKESIVGSPSCFIDNSIKEKESLYNSLDLNISKFHLFSHGRSGELLIEGKWLNASQIATFLISNYDILNSKVAELNIYGCEFAKGEKGLKAVAYLEKKLGLKVNASTNITGKDGDWLLEVGNVNVNRFASYTYNLQTCGNPGNVAASADVESTDNVVTVPGEGWSRPTLTSNGQYNTPGTPADGRFWLNASDAAVDQIITNNGVCTDGQLPEVVDTIDLCFDATTRGNGYFTGAILRVGVNGTLKYEYVLKKTAKNTAIAQ